MKYWRGLPGTPKEGEFGTMDDDGFVPDTEVATVNGYNGYVQSIPVVVREDTEIEKVIKYAKNKGWI